MEEQPGATLPEERRLHIAAQLRRESRVRVDDLARQFDVSGETIRRDLQVLEERGLLRRVYGGAVVAAPGPWDARLAEHLDPHGTPERQIGGLTSRLVEPGEVLVLHGDSVAVEVARQLPATWTGRVLCTSLAVVNELAGRDGIDVLVAGGQLRSRDLTLVGPVTERFFGEYFADKAFVGVGGVHPKAGLTGGDLADVAIAQAILRQARECYVLATSARIGRIAVARVAPLVSATAVITDAAADPEDIKALEQAGVRVLVGSGDPFAE